MLNETCLLVNLRIKLPPQSKTARAASEEVEARYRTGRKQGKVVKQLFSAKDIKPLQQSASYARRVFNDLSLPYDETYRIIPTTTYFEFMQKVQALSADFDAKKKTFLRDYHLIQMRSEMVLGDLHDENDYPTVDHLENLIGFTIESSTIPTTTAFDELAGLDPDTIEDLKAQAAAGQQEKVKQALEDLFRRLFKSLQKASVKLSDEDGIFRDTLLGNIDDALTAIDTLNFTDDQNLKDLATEVRALIEDITPDDLRTDKELRKETADQTKAVLNKMSEFF